MPPATTEHKQLPFKFNVCQDYVTTYITYQFVSGMKDIELSPSPGFSFVKVY